MAEEKNSPPEAGANNAPEEKVDNSAAAPVETKEAEEIKGLDPRVVEMVGKDKIQSAFGEKPEGDGKPAEEKKEVPSEESKKPEEKVEVKEEIAPRVIPQDPKPSRLDRHIAKLYIRNLHLMDAEKIPTEEEVLADLKQYSKEERIQAMHFHRLKGKELRGEKPTGDDLDEEDKAVIQDTDRESIRQEILAEQHQIKTAESYVEFVEKHPELLPENKKVYDPVLAKAVEKLTFPQGIEGPQGMSIQEAFETVTSQIQAVKESQVAEEKKKRDAALSGVMSGSGHIPDNGKELDWADVNRIKKENQPLYDKMLREGKFKHLM